MPDWTKSMSRTYEYYVVDPNTWKNSSILKNIKSSNIDRDLESDTLGSATLEVDKTLGECYIRIYLVTIQNGVTERFPLGTFLVQTPSSSFDGKARSASMDAYTPLIELKENPPPIGYYVPKATNVMDTTYRLTRENLRAPVVKPSNTTTLFYDFVADTSDTWLTFIKDLNSYAKYDFALDEMGRILFSPRQDMASLQPIWTYNDDNSSILYPDISLDHDLYGIPNAVEVLYSDGDSTFYHKVINDDPNSPTSTVNRGREILYRETDLSLIGDPSQNRIEQYANQRLKELSTVEYTVSYSHAYCPVNIGDCVRLNYERADIKNVKAKVISQSIECTPECKVSETALITTNLWG